MTLTCSALGAQTAKCTPGTPSTSRRCAPSFSYARCSVPSLNRCRSYSVSTPQSSTSMVPSATKTDVPPTRTREISPVRSRLDRDVNPARPSKLDTLQVQNRARLLGRDERVPHEVRAQRTARAARGRVFGDAEHRREHPRICGSRIRRARAIRREDVGLEVEQARIRHGAIDGGAGDERHEDERHAARHLLRPAARSRECLPPADPAPPRRAPTSSNVGPNSGFRCVIHAKSSREPLHSSETGVGPMFNPNTQSRATRGDRAVARERERAADDRMAGHRHLGARREDPHAHVGVGALGCGDERRFGKADLAGDLLHGLRRQARRLRKDRELVAAEPAIGEHVVVQVPVAGNAHARMFILAGSW